MTHTEFNHLLSQITALPPEQMRRLRQRLDRELDEPTRPLAKPAARKAKPPKAATAKKKPLTVTELHRKLLAEGRISHLPDTAADYDDPDDQPITIEGEPLSETIIRERR